MICVSVTPESRRLAKADILNASRQGDLVEVCLDKLIKKPDLGDMLSGCDKPILVSCRRKQDGGHWKKSEEERLQLLRSAIVANPAYVELEIDIADKIPRFGDVKRLISFNNPNTNKPLNRIDSFFTRARESKADAVKFAWPTSTLSETWPLLAAVSAKRELPVVAQPVGESDVTFSLLGRKFGSPWIYAALEQGMRCHTTQKTIWELNESYAWGEIDRNTKFVGIVGMGETELASVKVMNEAFREFGADVRCLPLRIGNIEKAKKMLSKLKIRGLIVGPQEVAATFPLIDHHHRTVEESRYGDLLLRGKDGWHGYNTLRRATMDTIKAAGRKLARRRVLVIGGNAMSRSLLPLLKNADAAISIATPDDKTATALAKEHGASAVQWAAIYDTMTDFLMYTDPSIPVSQESTRSLNPAILREHMTVVDVSRFPSESALAGEARARGCGVVEPHDIYLHQLSRQFKAITGKDLPPSALRDGLSTEL